MKQLLLAPPMIVVASLMILVSSPNAFATWLPDGAPVCIAIQDQQLPRITSDGAGGSIIVWQDWRSGNYDIYAQRMGPYGDPLWTVDGVVVCTADGDQVMPYIVSDEAGGAIIVCVDVDASSVRAQRLGPGGNSLWGQCGVLVCSGAGSETFPRCVSDGKGGAIIAWQDFRDGVDNDVYAQRIDANGNVKWLANGVAFTDEYSIRPELIPDGVGGAIITWMGGGIYAQRVDSLGSMEWGDGGVTIRPGTEGGGDSPRIVSDGAGGAVIAWVSSPNGHDGVFAQRVGPTGSAVWAANGVGLCVNSETVSNHAIASDGAGGAIVTWQDRREWTNMDLYARRVSSNGTPLWTDEGVAICAADEAQFDARLVSDGAGGAIIVWNDQRSGADIYSQRVNANGAPQWTENGVAVCTAAESQYDPRIASDGAGGAIATWCDYRDMATGVHIYAQRIYPGGALVGVDDSPSPFMGQQLDQNVPNPFNPSTTIGFTVAAPGRVTLVVYDIAGRQVRVLVDDMRRASRYEVTWDGKDGGGRAVASGLYLYKLETGQGSVTKKMILLR
jgi:hypothetical protein